MSLETLLEAARYVELQEKRKAKQQAAAAAAAAAQQQAAASAAAAAAAATAAAAVATADHANLVQLCAQAQLHRNHFGNAEPRGAKLKRERAEQDDLFCEEKMLIIDEEEPLESNNRANGNLQHLQSQQQTVVRASPAIGSPPSANFVVASAVQHQQQQQQQPQEAQLNHYLDNHKQGQTTAGGTLIVDVEGVHDSKKPRNGPCVIRSGTREVHNKLEKNRRAHLKECFELLKKQLPSQDEKKSSNLSILHAAIRHIQALRRKERDYEHEMERLAREKITAQQRLVSLKKELAATWDHIDFNTLIPDHNSTLESNLPKNVSESMEVDAPSGGLARSGTRYSSTSSLSSAATASSPQNNHQGQASSNGGNHNSNGNSNGASSSNIQSQLATAAVVCQTQGLNLAHSSRDSPPTSSSPGASTPSIPTPAQEKVTITPAVIQHSQSQPTQLHLPISAQMLNTSQGLATIVPALQQFGQGLRVIPADGRQLIAVQSNGTVTTGANGEARPVALVVHSTEANSENRLTFVHSTGTGDSRQLALAVQSSGNEVRPIVLTTPALNVTTATSRIRTGDAVQTTHKMIGGIASVGSPGCELARLPGGAELNILPANGQIFRSVKAPITVQGGLTLSHAGVSIQTAAKPGATIPTTSAQQLSGINGTTPSLTQQHEGIATSCHLVAPGHQSLAGLTSIVGPMAAVVSQGNTQGQTMIIASPSLAGKMISTNLLKNVTPIAVNAQYINNLVKPVMVVSTNHQQSQQQSQTTTANNSTAAASSQSAV